jgi:hypothetical protein
MAHSVKILILTLSKSPDIRAEFGDHQTNMSLTVHYLSYGHAGESALKDSIGISRRWPLKGETKLASPQL